MGVAAYCTPMAKCSHTFYLRQCVAIGCVSIAMPTRNNPNPV